MQRVHAALCCPVSSSYRPRGGVNLPTAVVSQAAGTRSREREFGIERPPAPTSARLETGNVARPMAAPSFEHGRFGDYENELKQMRK